jgi:hypothetical protein
MQLHTLSGGGGKGGKGKKGDAAISGAGQAMAALSIEQDGALEVAVLGGFSSLTGPKVRITLLFLCLFTLLFNIDLLFVSFLCSLPLSCSLFLC